MNASENQSPLPCPPLLSLSPQFSNPPPRLPWGFWVTAGLGVVLICGYMMTQAVAAILYLIGDAVMHGGKPVGSVETLATNGTLLSAAVISGAPVTIYLCGLFARLRQGPTLSSYLGLCWPQTRPMLWWTLGLLLLWTGSDALTIGLDRPIVPDVMAEIYWNTAFRPLIWMALVLAGPLAEEFIFRGFLFRGWKESRLGNWGTILLTSLLWAAIHVQYDLYGIGSIFIAGVFLGVVRAKTGSVLFCAFLHGVMNMIATIQIEFLTTAA